VTVHHLTRNLLQHAAVERSDPPQDPDRISLRRAQHLTRRSLAQPLSPADPTGPLPAPPTAWQPGPVPTAAPQLPTEDQETKPSLPNQTPRPLPPLTIELCQQPP
jgi:hypothetical protein